MINQDQWEWLAIDPFQVEISALYHFGALEDQECTRIFFVYHIKTIILFSSSLGIILDCWMSTCQAIRMKGSDKKNGVHRSPILQGQSADAKISGFCWSYGATINSGKKTLVTGVISPPISRVLGPYLQLARNREFKPHGFRVASKDASQLLSNDPLITQMDVT